MRVAFSFVVGLLLPGLWAGSTVLAADFHHTWEGEPDFRVEESSPKRVESPPIDDSRLHHTLELSPDFRVVDEEPKPAATATTAVPTTAPVPMPAPAAAATVAPGAVVDQPRATALPSSAPQTTSMPSAPAAPAWTPPAMRTEGGMTSSTAREDYRIGPNDLLLIEVFQVEELSGQERVNAGGQIILPLIGPVTVGGLTQSEAEQVIARELERDFLQNPQVNIYIEEYISQRVTVMGSVMAPGVFPLQGPTTLLQAIAMAGGIDKLADTEAVVVFRAEPEGVVGYVLNLDEIQEGQTQDPLVQNDDRIVVPKSGSKEMVESIANTLRGFIRFAPVY
jgi:polysaccharide export outer membrane protein